MTEFDTVKWAWAELQRMVDLLAEPWDHQVAYLNELFPSDLFPGGIVVDELGQEMNDVVPVAYDWEGNGPLSPDRMRAVRALDEAILAISGQENARFWTIEALRDAPEWEHIRHLAAEARAVLQKDD